MQHDDDDHDRDLAHDLQVIGERMMERRRALAWLAPAGGAAIAASTAVAAAAQMSRGGKGGSATRSGVITVGGGGRPGTTGGTSGGSSGGPSTGTTTTTITTTSSSSGCVADASETNVPYPADGTNTSSGSTSNVLTTSGIVRTDIRPSFISSTTTAQGVAITLTLVNVNSSCAPLAGYAVYIWQCYAAGLYSLYTAPKESYLRGVGVTDANDEVTFTTIFPGCYSGRWPHIHFEVYSSLSTATGARYASLIGQVAMPSAVCSTVYSGSSLYSSSVSNFRSVSLSSDDVFGDNTSAQLAQQTPTMSGSVSGGYAAAAKIGLAL